MDCGIPFCHQGCPLGNLIPDWNDLVYRDRWREAIDRLHATNNFPEFTGTLCPAPCEGSCVLGINDDAVTIKAVELAIIDRAFEEGWIAPEPPAAPTGKTVAVIGSGPAGLAAAQQLAAPATRSPSSSARTGSAGCSATASPSSRWRSACWTGGSPRWRRRACASWWARTSAWIGRWRRCGASSTPSCSAAGACAPRDLPIPGRGLGGVHFAMDYLTPQNRRCEGDVVPDEAFISAQGKRVVIIGGGDTGADCLGTAHRQGALEIYQLEILPRPPETRAADNPWPQWPNIYRVSSAHAEGGERVYSVSTTRFVGDERGRVKALEVAGVEPVREGGRLVFRDIPPFDVRLALRAGAAGNGLRGPRAAGPARAARRHPDRPRNVKRDENWMTSVPGVFTAGDMQRGQSLIVWAIAEGRSAARGVDRYLMGRSELPAPLP